jgi:hypothetical protein
MRPVEVQRVPKGARFALQTRMLSSPNNFRYLMDTTFAKQSAGDFD